MVFYLAFGEIGINQKKFSKKFSKEELFETKKLS